MADLRSVLTEGMLVRSRDGERLGRVVSCDATSFVIEKGFLFPRDFIAEYDDIAELREDEIILQHGKEELVSLGPSRFRDKAPHEEAFDRVSILGFKPHP